MVDGSVDQRAARPVTMPGALLRVEGALVAAGAIAAYVHLRGSWWLFLLLAFAPDLSMLGYLAGQRIGAVTYNVVHTYLLPGALLAAGLIFDARGAALVALIWLAHIGVDRLLTFGLKYPTAFQDTHLKRV
jgi:hypothetical protein